MTIPNVREIVQKYLKEIGADGLVRTTWSSNMTICHCQDIDLMLCTKVNCSCRPAVLREGKLVEMKEANNERKTND